MSYTSDDLMEYLKQMNKDNKKEFEGVNKKLDEVNKEIEELKDDVVKNKKKIETQGKKIVEQGKKMGRIELMVNDKYNKFDGKVMER